MSYSLLDENDPVVKMATWTVCNDMGIIPVLSNMPSIDSILHKMPAEERRIMKRKFHKAWRVLRKKEEKTIARGGEYSLWMPDAVGTQRDAKRYRKARVMAEVYKRVRVLFENIPKNERT